MGFLPSPLRLDADDIRFNGKRMLRPAKAGTGTLDDKLTHFARNLGAAATGASTQIIGHGVK